MRKLVICFGGADQAKVERVEAWTWKQFSTWLCKPAPVVKDKAARGWYIPVEFDPAYRHSDNFVARHAITFDFDKVELDTETRVKAAWKDLAYVLYTTYSHTDEKPRFRVVMPLSRPAAYDEYQALTRKVAEDIGIELVARESFTPSQMMYSPTCCAQDNWHSYANPGAWLDVDGVLAEYENWTDQSQWPHREEGDNVHAIASELTPPDQKPGIIGQFCRAFTVPEVIDRFDLPYTPTATEGRYTYTAGSRPEGAIVYDNGLKFHSHHDSDVARGQHNAFDLVRLCKYHALDEGTSREVPVTERPSFKAMVRFALDQPELQEACADAEFGDLGPLEADETLAVSGSHALARRICDVLSTPTTPSWLLEDVVERGIIGILAGPRGSYKSFIALDWAMRIATRKDAEPVYVVSAEGGDFDRRAAAWLKHFDSKRDPATVPLYVVERRIDLSSKDGIESIRRDCVTLSVRPSLFVLDTFSKLSGGLDENDNSAVKQFIGRLDNGLKRADTGFGATVLIIAHTGHSNAGRARGASALAADTDAEYIVSRDQGGDTVSLSRERFKSSPELAPLCYKPEIISLDRSDPLGKPVSSLIMAYSAPSTTRTTGKQRPQGALQLLVYDVLKVMSFGASVNYLDLVEGCLLKLPKPAGRDTRKSTIERALTGLISKGLAHMQGEDRVAMSAAVEVEGTSWLE